ncbi:MAG TPA: IS200/IS605 family transposase [Candidatus Binatia bacterium]
MLTALMAQSLSNCIIHLIFSTKERRSFLAHTGHRVAMHRYLGAVSTRLDCPVIRVGGVADHVHCLARQARTITVAEWVKELKRASSQWAKAQDASLRGFQWQAGYAAFSVSQSLGRKVEQYIGQQEEHHCRLDFQSELRKLLNAHGVGYEERYVWD